MKKFLGILLTAFYIFSLTGCARTLEFEPLETEKINYITIGINGEEKTTTDKEDIAALCALLNGDGRTTKILRRRDKISEDIAQAAITVQFENKTGDIYLYKNESRKAFYLSQAPHVPFEITKDEYNAVFDLCSGVKGDVTRDEREQILKAVENLSPLDEHGENFTTEAFTNSRLLRYAVLQLQPENKVLGEVTFDMLNEKYIKGTLGVTTATPDNITCACGQTIAAYSSETDTFTWDETFHYKEHIAPTYNKIFGIYKDGDKYVVNVYKIFSKPGTQKSDKVENLYSTYNNAKEGKGMYPGITGSPKFVELAPAHATHSTMYKLTFRENMALESYEILGEVATEETE